MNYTVGEIIDIMERLAPSGSAMDFDNVGLMVGDRAQKVKKLMLALDITHEVISEAIEQQADLIITHHPLIFSRLRSVTAHDYVPSMVLRLCRAGISVFSAHTNLDVAAGGVTDALINRLLPGVEFTKSEDGLVAAARLKTPLSADGLSALVKTALGCPALRVSGSRRNEFSKIAVSGGSGHDSVETALKMGADAFITGEISYHYAASYERMDMSIIEAGHFYSELPILDYLAKYLQNTLNSVEYNLSIDISKRQHSPYVIW